MQRNWQDYLVIVKFKNRTLIGDVKIKEYILLFGENQENTKSEKKSRIIKNRKKSKNQRAKLKKRLDDSFGLENTKKDFKLAKKLMHLFGDD